MPSGKSWFYFVFVNLGFFAYVMGCFYITSIQEIKDNWPKYRCNPMYMPLSDDINTDFTYCVQNIQSGFMGHLLAPLTFITSSLSNMIGSSFDQINGVRAMFNKLRGFFSNIFQTIFGVFFNLIIEFMRIIIGIKDLFGKTIGILATFMYVMEGSILTIQSMWNGPSGQLVKALGKCFHPDTKVRLESGGIKCMKDVELGDVLENGSIVEAVMRIDNIRNPVPFYELPNMGIGGETIYLTGSHSIYDTSLKQFVKIQDYKHAVKTDEVAEWFSCLITNDHKIGISGMVYWDWEDQLLYGV